MSPDSRADAHPALKVFSVNGVKEVMFKLGDEFRAATGHEVRFTFGTAGVLQEKMAAGDMPDVLVAIPPAMAKAEQQDLIAKGSSVEVSRTGLGLAVKAGAPMPDVSTPQAFRDTLLKAKSLAYSDPKTGAASGVAFAKILAQMGIVDQVKDKTVLTTGGPAGELVAEGRVELGVQQVTELLPVKGISLLGSLPADIQVVTIYSAAILRRSLNQKLAADFISFVTGPKVARVFSEAGFGRY